ncbi:MAG: caspase family protein, partial [Deltaproteobacteria bacterium]|nr:caspase family protein [Deltaproteobacteria bacterium]
MKTVNRKHATGLFFTLTAIVFALICHHFAFVPACCGAQSKGIKVVIADSSGKRVGLYEGSYALVVGVSDYTTREWPDLESIPSEIAQVASALDAQGFHVRKVLNPTSRQLVKAFEDFIDDYGFDANNRLVFFFSGHGYTRKGGRKGYLVPADAPDPRSDEKGFARKALNMSQIMAWCRRIEAKHALFLFDSCFSGSIFKVKALPSHPPHISDYTARPVRQFITAGSAGEEVPAQSIFTPLVLRALRGDADVDKDGYVTGTELGMYLHRRVLHYNRGQTPQYGKMKDTFYDEGNFVFQLASSGATVTKPVPSRKTTLSVSANVTGARVLVD